jgi:hypothetical protein
LGGWLIWLVGFIWLVDLVVWLVDWLIPLVDGLSGPVLCACSGMALAFVKSFHPASRISRPFSSIHPHTKPQARAEAKEYRETVLEGIKLASEQVGKGFQEFLADPDRLTSAAVTVSAIALGVYTAKVSTGVAGRYIEARLGKPSLVRDTSRRTLGQVLRNPLPSLRRLFTSAQAEDALKGVVLEPALTERLKRVAVSTAHTKANGAPFRNLLLHGPPGTGTCGCCCCCFFAVAALRACYGVGVESLASYRPLSPRFVPDVQPTRPPPPPPNPMTNTTNHAPHPPTRQDALREGPGAELGPGLRHPYRRRRGAPGQGRRHGDPQGA